MNSQSSKALRKSLGFDSDAEEDDPLDLVDGWPDSDSDDAEDKGSKNNSTSEYVPEGRTKPVDAKPEALTPTTQRPKLAIFDTSSKTTDEHGSGGGGLFDTPSAKKLWSSVAGSSGSSPSAASSSISAGNLFGSNSPKRRSFTTTSTDSSYTAEKADDIFAPRKVAPKLSFFDDELMEKKKKGEVASESPHLATSAVDSSLQKSSKQDKDDNPFDNKDEDSDSDDLLGMLEEKKPKQTPLLSTPTSLTKNTPFSSPVVQKEDSTEKPVVPVSTEPATATAPSNSGSHLPSFTDSNVSRNVFSSARPRSVSLTSELAKSKDNKKDDLFMSFLKKDAEKKKMALEKESEPQDPGQSAADKQPKDSVEEKKDAAPVETTPAPAVKSASAGTSLFDSPTGSRLSGRWSSLKLSNPSAPTTSVTSSLPSSATESSSTSLASSAETKPSVEEKITATPASSVVPKAASTPGVAPVVAVAKPDPTLTAEISKLASKIEESNTKLVSKMEETKESELRAKEENLVLSNQLTLMTKKHAQEIIALKEQYEEKIAALKAEIAQKEREKAQQIETTREIYEDKLRALEFAKIKEKQADHTAEASLLQRIQELTERFTEEKRALRKTHEEALAAAMIAKETAIRAAEQKAREEIAHSIAMHKDALDAKEKQFMEYIENQNKIHKQEMQAMAQFRSSSEGLASLVEQIQVSAISLKSIQQKIESENVQLLQEREAIVRTKERELKKLEEIYQEKQHEAEQERRRLEGMVAQIELRVKELQQASLEERKSIQQELKRLETRKQEFEVEVKMTRDNLEKEYKNMQAQREHKLKEKEEFISETMQERRAIAEERRYLSEMKKKIDDHDDSLVRRLREKEAIVEAERFQLAQDRIQIERDKEWIAIEKERVIHDRTQLQREIADFRRETEELTKMSLQVQQQSEEVARLHQEVVAERMKAQQMRDEAQTIYHKTALERPKLEEKEALLQEEQKAVQKQRVEIAKERKKLLEEKIAASKTIESAKVIQDKLESLEHRIRTPDPPTPYQHPYTSTPVAYDLQTHLNRLYEEQDSNRSHLESQAQFLASLSVEGMHSPRFGSSSKSLSSSLRF